MDVQNLDGSSPFADAAPRREAVRTLRAAGAALRGLLGLQAAAEATDEQAGSGNR